VEIAAVIGGPNHMYGTDGEMTRPPELEPEPGPAPGRGPEPAGPPAPEAARAAGSPGRESTGDERVDAATARLAELDSVPTASHPEIFQDVHRRLQEALTGIDGEQP
jgi:hypothetical protein